MVSLQKISVPARECLALLVANLASAFAEATGHVGGSESVHERMHDRELPHLLS